MIAPHGGSLVDRTVSPAKRQRLKEEAMALPRISIGRQKALEIENIATGVYTPLKGFMTRTELSSVLEEGRLPGGLPWTLPVTLDISPDRAEVLMNGPKSDGAEGAQEAALFCGDQLVALLEIEDIFPLDRHEVASSIYGTTTREHPGVERLEKKEDVLVGGRVTLIEPIPTRFPHTKLTPRESRVLFAEKGWKTVVGFQTRNAPHLGHEYVQKSALTLADGIFLNPVIGPKKPGDFRDEVILKAYETLIREYYPASTAVLGVIEYEMRYAGPREAVHHALMRKNLGCTHFIVGRDHAGVGDYYGMYEAQEYFNRFPDLGIRPIPFKSFYYCNRCHSMVNEKTCPHGEDQVVISGTKIRSFFNRGEGKIDHLMRPEVIAEIQQFDRPLV